MSLKLPLIFLGFVLCLTSVVVSSAPAETLTVSAAISLKEPLEKISRDFEQSTGDTVSLNLDASGLLARQIEQGAPVDLFIAADNQDISRMIKSGDAAADSKQIIATNQLVLITSRSSSASIQDFADLKSISGKIAIGDPKIVPAGRYASQVFANLKLTDGIAQRLVQAENVRQVLTYVERDEVAAGVVYTTDARGAGDAVRVVATANADLHDRIEYPAVIITASSHQKLAGRFLQFLTASSARKTLTDAGFELPTPVAATGGSPTPAAAAVPGRPVLQTPTDKPR